MEVLHQLVRVVGRSFYDDKTVVILDTIVRETMVPDDVVVDRMQIIGRDFNRILARLFQERLVKYESRQQPRADNKIITRNFLYIDYKQFVDIVKFRIYKMRHSVEEMIKKEMESKGYICPSCRTIFGSLDVSRLLNVRTGSFECDICPDVELQYYDPLQAAASSSTEPSVKADGPHELHSRLMEQTKQVVDLLKKADEISIPVFHPLVWLEQHGSKYSLISLSSLEDEPGLAIAGGSGTSTPSFQSVSVELAAEGALDESSFAASPSNPLPEWHRYSTVTGEAIRAENGESKERAEWISEDSDNAITTDNATAESEISSYYAQLGEERIDEEAKKPPKQSKHDSPSSTSISEPITSCPMVTVAGKPIPFDQVTEEDKDRMTEDEYAQYYEVHMSQTSQ